MKTSKPNKKQNSLVWHLYSFVFLYLFDVLFIGQYFFFFVGGIWILFRLPYNGTKKILRVLMGFVLIIALIAATQYYDCQYAMYKAKKLIHACQQYKDKYKKYPDKLEDLVPEFATYIPIARMNILWGKFDYYSSENSHSLMWIIFPPFLRRYYSFEDNYWEALD